MNYKLWCDDNKEWEKDEWVVTSNGNFVWVRDGMVTPPSPRTRHILLKGSGIKDRDGTELFELDIVEYIIIFKEKLIKELGIVLFNEGMFYIEPLRNTYDNNKLIATIGEKEATDIIRKNMGLKVKSNACIEAMYGYYKFNWED